ncbi:acyl-homoserine-lactone synthase [Acetobacter cibinongensis]|uniref:Acyl-homoserine-lactone synthase n=1 Tax=Acetobacter cibinongensis TaxID=146475 RepID=A0A0D6MZZ7_9PROT|nr:acyl-homoserine-lactone synthase [Acetobacter cibinongensis]GAN59317.1 autoinducer synthesis protein [Acetobacter cibinongensis]GBQ13703.1 N-acyl-L-homoserine lactone synthetase [Acetobacter cibinongensis NRIC 0482]GEL59066.1 acyl-homoserine-lactone synthase [Acetobacter cibinongensis]
MLYTFSYEERHDYASVYDKMLQARALVFGERLGWDVVVRHGREEDEYDREYNPLYIVSLNESGQHAASLRVLPTTGPTMLRQEFHTFFDDCPDIVSPDVWECTRLCSTVESTTPAGRSVTIDVTKALCRTAFESGISQITGIYYKGMTRVYRRIGWEPTTLSQAKPEIGDICLGLWTVTPRAMRHMAERQAMLF